VTEDNFQARARVIAKALARTSDHHRKTALIAGGVALASCGLTFASDRLEAKGVALAIAVIFAVSCYRSIRTANNYIDPAASPVLMAVANAPADIVSVVYQSTRSVVRIKTEDGTLDVRIDEDTPAEPLLRALEAHAPNAEIARE
jgi:hypothetical protein